MHLPLQEGRFDSASIILAPFPNRAIRIVKRGGQLLRVTPGADHLKELKRYVYREVRLHARGELELPGLQLRQSEALKFTMYLNDAARLNLFAMTPMQHRAKWTLVDMPKSEVLPTTAHFCVDVFERTGRADTNGN